jgi:hypothetical protein
LPGQNKKRLFVWTTDGKSLALAMSKKGSAQSELLIHAILCVFAGGTSAAHIFIALR